MAFDTQITEKLRVFSIVQLKKNASVWFYHRITKP